MTTPRKLLLHFGLTAITNEPIESVTSLYIKYVKNSLRFASEPL
jgi:hypothetical protein